MVKNAVDLRNNFRLLPHSFWTLFPLYCCFPSLEFYLGICSLDWYCPDLFLKSLWPLWILHCSICWFGCSEKIRFTMGEEIKL